MHIDWNTLWSSAIGALIGSALTLLATYLAYRLQHAEQRESDEQNTLAFLQAIHDEMQALWEIYSERVGNHLDSLENGQPFRFLWPVGEGYFTIYDTNAENIGRVKDSILRKNIVKTYTAARSLLDSYRANNSLLERWEQAALPWNQVNSEENKSRLQALDLLLSNYGQALKGGHLALKVSVEELLMSLRKHGVAYGL